MNVNIQNKFYLFAYSNNIYPLINKFLKQILKKNNIIFSNLSVNLNFLFYPPLLAASIKMKKPINKIKSNINVIAIIKNTAPIPS